MPTLVHLSLGAEGVGAEGCVVDLVGKPDGFVKISDWENRQERAEALVADERVVDALYLNDSGLDEEISLVHGAANHDSAVARVEHLLQAQELALVYNAAVVRRVAGALGVELFQGVLHLLDKSRENLAVDKGAVLANADLAGVQHLRPQQALCGQLGVGVLGDDGRVPAAELERQRCECLGSLLRDDLSHRLRARVEDLVPLLLKQRGGLGHGTLYARVAVGVQRLGQDLLHDARGVGRRLGRLDNGGAARGNGTNERPNGQLDGKVVCANDQNSTERVLANAGPHKLVGEGDVCGLLVLGEAVEVVGHEDAIVHDPRDLGEVRLELRLAQVLLARLLNQAGIVLERPIQLAQLHLAVFEIACLVREERLAGGCACWRNLVHGRVLESGDCRCCHGAFN